MATLQDLMGAGIPAGLLNPQQEQALQERAKSQGLLNLGFALLQASQGQPGQGKPRLGQIIGQAGPAFAQGYRGAFDETLQNIVRGQQLQELQRKRQQEQAQMAAREQFGQMFAPRTPQAALQAPGQVGPTAARAATIGQTPPLDRNQLLSQILNPNLPPDLRNTATEIFKATAPAELKAAPGIVGEFQAATANGLIPATTTLAEYIQMKKPPAPSATAIAGGGRDVFGEEVAKAEAKNFAEIRKSGNQAQSALREVERLDTILSRIETGGAAAFKQAAGNLGIKTEGVEDIQAAQAIINKLVPAQRPPGSGTMSDADLALYKESLPRIINQPGANKEIVRSMREINRYLVEEGKIAADVIAKRITPEEGTRKMFELGNPVQDFFDRTQGGAGLSAGQPMPQGDLELINRYLNRGR